MPHWISSPTSRLMVMKFVLIGKMCFCPSLVFNHTALVSVDTLTHSDVMLAVERNIKSSLFPTQRLIYSFTSTYHTYWYSWNADLSHDSWNTSLAGWTRVTLLALRPHWPCWAWGTNTGDTVLSTLPWLAPLSFLKTENYETD